MKNYYKIEFRYKNDVIDWKESDLPLIIPHKGETIRIVFENPANSEGYDSWIVDDIEHCIWNNPEKLLVQLIIIHIHPK